MRHVPYMINQIMIRRFAGSRAVAAEATGGPRAPPRAPATRAVVGAGDVWLLRCSARGLRCGGVPGMLLNMFVKPAPHAHTMRIHMAKDADRPWASRAPDAQLGAMSPYARTSSTARS